MCMSALRNAKHLMYLCSVILDRQANPLHSQGEMLSQLVIERHWGEQFFKTKICMGFLVFSFELFDSHSVTQLLVWGDAAVIYKVLPSTGLTQLALGALSYTALLTYCHLAPLPMTVSQQIKAPILQALHACGQSELITCMSV